MADTPQFSIHHSRSGERDRVEWAAQGAGDAEGGGDEQGFPGAVGGHGLQIEQLDQHRRKTRAALGAFAADYSVAAKRRAKADEPGQPVKQAATVPVQWPLVVTPVGPGAGTTSFQAH